MPLPSRLYAAHRRFAYSSYLSPSRSQFSFHYGAIRGLELVVPKPASHRHSSSEPCETILPANHGSSWTFPNRHRGRFNPSVRKVYLGKNESGHLSEELKSSTPIIKDINPSKRLVEALVFAGHVHALPHQSQEHYWESQDGNGKSEEGNAEFLQPPAQGGRDSVKKYILAKFIHMSHIEGCQIEIPQNSGWRMRKRNVIEKTFDKQTLKLLETEGYIDKDVAGWAWIITARSSEEAALYMLRMCNRRWTAPYPAVPSFVLLFLLRRSQLTVSALELLLIHAFDRSFRLHNPSFELDTKHLAHLYGSSASHTETDRSSYFATYKDLTDVTFVLMIGRLLNHARNVWAPALPAISSLFAEFFAQSSKSEGYRPHTRGKIASKYNNMLKQLGIPSAVNPYMSVPHHQEAQLKLLRHMSRFEPPIMINREGYRAVALVQLRHLKSIEEQEWAAMKASSWPPWKQDRTGLDAEIGPEHGISRAKQILIKLNEAGYGTHQFEEEATMLAGWDTDETPTIQTRAILNTHLGRVGAEHSSGSTETAGSEVIWAARIKATRTLDEAWSVFLTYRDSKSPVYPRIYYTMATKISFAELSKLNQDSKSEEILNSLHDRKSRVLLPGDGLEISPPPKDPRERIYVRVSPPTFQGFLDAALVDGIRFNDSFLAFLLRRHATSVEDCEFFFKYSTISGKLTDILFQEMPEQVKLRQIPREVFAGFIDFLCRSDGNLPQGFEIGGSLSGFHTVQNNVIINKRLHAFKLALISEFQHRPVWYSLIQALAREVGNESALGTNANLRRGTMSRILNLWKNVVRLVETLKGMDIELSWSAFAIVCQIYGKVSHEYMKLTLQNKVERETTTDESDNIPPSNNLCSGGSLPGMAEVMENGSTQLRSMFQKLVFTKTEGHKALHAGMASFEQDSVTYQKDILPRVLEVPSPAHLHVYIRALGFRHDFQGLEETVKWMVEFAPEINTVMREVANGFSQTRKSLVALRIFLEGNWVRDIAPDLENIGVSRLHPGQAPQDLIERVSKAIDEVSEWGGWPSDAEVRKYLDSRP